MDRLVDHVNGFKAMVAMILTALTALWGWFGWLVVVWIVFMAMDYITGSMAASKKGEWSSRVAREGHFHKGGCIAVVLMAVLMDIGVGFILANIGDLALPFEYTVFLAPLVVVWYLLTEAGSIIENAGAMGAPIPEWLKKAIAAFRDKVDKGSENNPAGSNGQAEIPE